MKFICLAYNPPFPFPHILCHSHYTKTVAHTGHTSLLAHINRKWIAQISSRIPNPPWILQVHSTFYFNSIYLFFFVAFLMRFVVAHILRVQDKCVFNIGIDKTRLTKRSLFLISFWFVPWPRQKILHRVCVFCLFSSVQMNAYEQRAKHSIVWAKALADTEKCYSLVYRWSLKRQSSKVCKKYGVQNHTKDSPINLTTKKKTISLLSLCLALKKEKNCERIGVENFLLNQKHFTLRVYVLPSFKQRDFECLERLEFEHTRHFFRLEL